MCDTGRLYHLQLPNAGVIPDQAMPWREKQPVGQGKGVKSSSLPVVKSLMIQGTNKRNLNNERLVAEEKKEEAKKKK